MKKVLFAALAIIALVSCSKNENTNEILSNEQSTVNISFVEAETHASRAFFATTASAEIWEKTLSSVTIIAFNDKGNTLVQRQFTPSELSSKTAAFVLPNTTAGDNCEFYAVANIDVTTIATKTALLALLENSASAYNGTFAEVNSKSKRAGGFVMSGNISSTISNVGASTSVAITLKRTVAKVAIETVQSPDFNSKYTGTVKINSVKLVKGASQTPIIKPTTTNSGAMSFSHTQSSNVVSNKGQNLFYIFENGALSVGSRVAIELNATYDADGNFSTTADQTPMTYTVELDGATNGTILRNGYYRLQIAITGLTGNDTSATITVADWETPVTQTVNVGQ